MGIGLIFWGFGEMCSLGVVGLVIVDFVEWWNWSIWILVLVEDGILGVGDYLEEEMVKV